MTKIVDAEEKINDEERKRSQKMTKTPKVMPKGEFCSMMNIVDAEEKEKRSRRHRRRKTRGETEVFCKTMYGEKMRTLVGGIKCPTFKEHK